MPSDGSAALAAFEEYAVEASIAKVAGSEALNYVLDENIQIHGGNGYVHDYPAERHYRDARVNRIFEGTNEINRLLIPGMLIRRALKGDLPLIPAAKALQDELLGPPSMPASADGDGVLAEELRAVAAFKKTALMVFGLAMQTFGTKLTDEQEVLMHLADITIDVFSAESAVLRAQAADASKAPKAALHADAARVFVNDAAMRIDASARQALAATVDGDTLRTMLAALRRLLKVTPINTVARAAAARRRHRRARGLSACVGRMGGWAGQAGGSVLACELARWLAACSPDARARSRPPDEPKDYAGEDRGGAGGEGRGVRGGATIRSRRRSTRSSCRSPTSRSIPTTTCPARSSRSTTRRSIEMPTSTGANRKMRRVGSLEFTLKGQPMKLLAFNELGTDPGVAVRAFSDLTSGTETYPAGRFMDLARNADRHLRSRLQPRLHPVLLLQPDLRVPATRRGEPAEDSDSRRRERMKK